MSVGRPFIDPTHGAVTLPCWEPIAARWVILEIPVSQGKPVVTLRAMENPPAPPEEFRARH